MLPPEASANGQRAEPTMVFVDGEHATGVLGNVLVTFSKSEPSKEFLENWAQKAKQLAAEYQQVAALIVIDSAAKPPRDAIRSEIHQTLSALGSQIVAIAQVVEGHGFLAAAKRSALSMIALITRYPFPVRIFGEVLDGSVWLAMQLPPGASKFESSQLMKAAEAVRRAQLTRHE